jgi:uncharacterized membrane protein YqgA involved in biofilm formation
MNILFGSIVNAAAIIAGGAIGLLFNKGISRRFETLLMDALALVIFLIGLMSALKTQEIMLMVISLVIGGLLGEAMRLEDRLLSLGRRLEARLLPAKRSASDTDGQKRKPGQLALGFVHASLVFCIGSMAIIGALESGLTGQHQTLLAKALLDGIISVFFAATLGAGVLISALPVLIYEGAMSVGASAVRDFLSPVMVTEISAIGGILIMALGVNMTKLKTIKVVNLLPSLLVALLWFVIRSFF